MTEFEEWLGTQTETEWYSEWLVSHMSTQSVFAIFQAGQRSMNNKCVEAAKSRLDTCCGCHECEHEDIGVNKAIDAIRKLKEEV